VESPVDNVQLLFPRKFYEVDSISADTDGELRIQLGVLHRIEQDLAIQDIHIDMVAGFMEVPVQQGDQVPHLLVPAFPQGSRDDAESIGDSILGTGAHLGAGVILANLRLDKGEVIVDTPEGRQSTGLRKLGAILGEYAEAGCNAVLQPGTILGKRAMVMSTLAFSGFLAENTIAHAHQPIRRILRRD